MFWLRITATDISFTALLPYCPTALLPYCPTALIPYRNHAAIPGLRAEHEAVAFIVPAHAGDCALAGAAQQHFLAVGKTCDQDHAVAIADRRNVLDRMAGNRCHHAVTAKPKLQRGLAHRTVLAREGPDDCRGRAGSGEPLGLGAPRPVLDLRRIAGHAHVLRIFETPAMQRIFLHRGDEEASVGREGHP